MPTPAALQPPPLSLVGGDLLYLSLKFIIIHRRVRGVGREIFYFLIKHFLLCDLYTLCGEKNIIPNNGKISRQGNHSSILLPGANYR
jgi:hypothetical protein